MCNALGARGQQEEEREAKEEWRHMFKEESGWVSTGMMQGGPPVTGADVPIGKEGSKSKYTLSQTDTPHSKTIH